MNLTCSILHANEQIAHMLEQYVEQTPFLTLCGTYTRTGDALKDYYNQKVDIYFIGLEESEEDELSGLEFARLLSQPTRCIFIAHDGSYASECFRLDALDYLEGDIQFPVFFQAISKALRWFSLQRTGLTIQRNKNENKEDGGLPDVIYIKAESRLIRLKLTQIYYIEGLGDYVKIFCSDETKPILSLCSLLSAKPASEPLCQTPCAWLGKRYPSVRLTKEKSRSWYHNYLYYKRLFQFCLRQPFAEGNVQGNAPTAFLHQVGAGVHLPAPCATQ